MVTVDEIFDQVRATLQATDTEQETTRLKRALARVPGVIEQQSTFRARQMTRVQTNMSRLTKRECSWSVRILGVEVGSIKMCRERPLLFRSGTWKPLRDIQQRCFAGKAVPWRSANAREYLETAERLLRRKHPRPESVVQQALLDAFDLPSEQRPKPLRNRTPCKIANIPVQLPLPRGFFGTKHGNLDVVARSGRGPHGGTLSVFELKAPGASSGSALHQAVSYVAQLCILMEVPETRDLYWRVLGPRNGGEANGRFEAVAFVADTRRNEQLLTAAVESLQKSNQAHIKLTIMLYDMDDLQKALTVRVVEA